MAKKATTKNAKKKPVWAYSEFRATLTRDDEFFALITPDGKNALPEDKVTILLDALNRK